MLYNIKLLLQTPLINKRFGMRIPPYILMSFFVFAFIMSGFIYSYYFYPDKHPVTCVIKQITGKNCPSCGFSKSFSYYSHFQIEEGKTNNDKSFAVLMFFLFQLLLRSVILIWFFTTHKVIANKLIKIDLIISISTFLLAFLPLLIFY